MDATFSRHWRTTTYKTHRTQVLLDREKALFPETLSAVQVEKRKRYLQAKRKKLLDKIAQLQDRVDQLDVEIVHLASQETKKSKKEKIMCQCPSDDCRGFVYQHNHTCAICDVKVCHDCFKQLPSKDSDEPEHECAEDDKATAELIKKECRPCPSCAVPIHRWTGCPMMWCTNCNTAFDWHSLEVIKHDNIHNPHYMEYLERQQQHVENHEENLEINHDGCRREPPTPLQLSRHLRNTVNMPVHQREIIMEKQRVMLHIADMLRGPVRAHHAPTDNIDLRVKYLIGDMDEDTFKKKVMDREIHHEKQRTIHYILETVRDVSRDILSRMWQHQTCTEVFKDSDELDKLYSYMHECFEKQKKRFGSLRKPKIPDWPIPHAMIDLFEEDAYLTPVEE